MPGFAVPMRGDGPVQTGQAALTPDDVSYNVFYGFSYDNKTVESSKALVDGARAGNPPAPTRGPNRLVTFKEASAVLAGLDDGLAEEGVQAGTATLLGLKLAKEGK